MSRPDIAFSGFDASYTAIKKMENRTELPESIYCYETNPWTAQFMCNRYSVYDIWPDESLKDAIIFSTVSPGELDVETAGYYTWAILDNEEYMYIKGMKYTDIFKANGYELEEMIFE